MVNIIVIHQWKNEQKDKAMKFVNTIVEMAKSKKLPSELNLIEVSLAQNANVAVCRWEADSLQHLISVASTLKPDWQVSAYEINRIY